MISAIEPTKYLLKSVDTNETFEDTYWILDPPNSSKPSLVRAVYEKKQITLKPKEFGIYTFADWLPINRTLIGSGAPITFKSENLANYLGLTNLWITFSGYFPERGAAMKGCSFKDTEAYTVCARLNKNDEKILVVASAGNTARSFAKVCSDNNIKLLLCVPEDNLSALWFDSKLKDCVKLVCSEKGSDYFDAIQLSNYATELDIYRAEGGAKNIARRDGMATTTLSAVTTIGSIPEYYFQAVGSGTGAVAAWEANLRLIEDGRFGTNKMKLMVSQNIPFTPIYDAWQIKSREMLPLDDTLARTQVEEITAKVLSNRKPPYPIIGGLFDALTDTNGEVLLATNEELDAALDLFLKFEGIDIHPASAVALATLIKETKNANINKDACIMLNITGGGEKRMMQDSEIHYLKPTKIFKIGQNKEEIKRELIELFK